MFSLLIPSAAEDRDLLVADLWELGSAGIAETEDGAVRAFFEDSADLDALLALYPQATLRREETRDWVQSARDLLQPMLVGRRFFLAPDWRDDPTPPGRFRIAVNPGLAFGTGVHETTQLCIEALEDYLCPGARVLDVGTGSGILAQAAKLLGAGTVFVCDTDPIAIEIAKQQHTGRAFTGSVEAVRAGSIDLVLANISPEAIVQLTPHLLASLRPGGVLLASGFEIREVDLVGQALPAIENVRQKGNWALAVIRRS